MALSQLHTWAMESRKLTKNKADLNIKCPWVVEKTIESRRERVDTIIKDVEDLSLREFNECKDPSDADDFTQDRRELLRKNRFDPKADIIFQEVSETVAILADDPVKTELQHFLSSYQDLREQQWEICTKDREAVLLELKADLEKIAEDGNSSGLDHSLEKLDSTGHVGELINDDFQFSIRDGAQTPLVLARKVSKTLNSLEGLKETRLEMKKANVQMEGLCACLEFRKMKTEAKRAELFVHSVKLSDDLTKMNTNISSNSLKRDTHFQKTLLDAKRKMSECMEMHRNWKMQEILFSNLLEDKNATLKSLKTIIKNHRGKKEKEAYEKKENRIKSHQRMQSREYFKRLNNTLQRMSKVQSHLLGHAVVCRKTMCENMESFDETCEAFEKLESSFRLASSCWSTDRDSTHLPLTAGDRELECRLQNTLTRIAAEKSVSCERDGDLLRYIAHNDDSSINEIENSTNSDTDEFEDIGSDLQSSLRELDALVHQFVSSARGAFTTLNALQKLDVCLGFSFSRLSVLEFDLTNKKTYSEARSNALSSCWHQYLQRGCAKRGDQQLTPKGNDISSNASHQHTSGNSVSRVDQSKSMPKLKSQRVNLFNGGNPTVVCPRNESEYPLSCRKRRHYRPVTFNFRYPRLRTLSRPKQPLCELEKTRTREKQTGNEKNCKGELSSEEMFMREQAVREQCALDMTNHFRLHEQNYHFSPLDLPIKFLFYTKGIGVFIDYRGRLVDALGLPFPKQRRDCPGGSAHAGMTPRAGTHIFGPKAKTPFNIDWANAINPRVSKR